MNVKQAKDVLARAEMIEAKVERTRRAIEEYFGLSTEVSDRGDNYALFLVKSPTGKTILSSDTGGGLSVSWQADGNRCSPGGPFRELSRTIEKIWESAVA